jgi:hypothetical protein
MIAIFYRLVMVIVPCAGRIDLRDMLGFYITVSGVCAVCHFTPDSFA